MIFDLALDFVMGVGPNITASVIYDAAKSLFRRGTTNTFDIAFKESRRGTRSLKVAIKFSTDEELKIALDRLPQVLESGARGTFAHHGEGYVRVDSEAPSAVNTSDGTLEIEGPEQAPGADAPQAGS